MRFSPRRKPGAETRHSTAVERLAIVAAMVIFVAMVVAFAWSMLR
jgi:hypothetical protein